MNTIPWSISPWSRRERCIDRDERRIKEDFAGMTASTTKNNQHR